MKKNHGICDINENNENRETVKSTEFCTPGIPDSCFIRGDVPMTKEEIRIFSVSKLHLSSKSVVYDIGSGTGSVAVEIARLSPDIEVYAVEINSEGIKLINQNATNFGCSNIHAVQALAPAGLENLPTPTHAFIGGTKGNLLAIIEALREKNPKIRIVGTAVTLETVAEMQNALKNLPVTDDDVVQVSVSRAEKVGGYRMMKANNPVFIYSFTFSGAD
jgi:precorrin-6Y C5,15-methyltransferase (decarboxylating)